jgi:hypothetical protein
LHSLNSGGLKLYEAEGLKDELLGLRLRQSASGAWSFDHASGAHDDMAVALSLMLVGALERLPQVAVIAPPSAEGRPLDLSLGEAGSGYARGGSLTHELLDEGRF